MVARLGCRDRLLGVKAAGGGQYHQIGPVLAGKQVGVAGVEGGRLDHQAGFGGLIGQEAGGRRQPLGQGIAEGHQAGPLVVLKDRGDVLCGDPPAAGESDPHGPLADQGRDWRHEVAGEGSASRASRAEATRSVRSALM